MNKKIFGLLGCVVVGGLISFNTSAFTLDSGERVTRTETVNDDLYIAGSDISNDALINGDLTVAGANLRLNGEVTQDVSAAGANIAINGSVGDDLRVAGSDVQINNNVAGDLIVFGANVMIKQGITIGGDIIVMGGNVTMNGSVAGDAIINAGHLSLAGTIGGNADMGLENSFTLSTGAQIGGTLSYKARQKLTDLEAITAGEVSFEQTYMPQGDHMKSMMMRGAKYMIAKWLYLIVFASLILMWFSGFANNAAQSLIKKPWMSIVYGLAILAGVPLLVLLLCVTMIGLPVGMLLLTAYIFLFVFAELIGVVVFTPVFKTLFKNKSVWKWWEQMLLVAGVALLFTLISGVDMLAVLFAWGAIALTLKK